MTWKVFSSVPYDMERDPYVMPKSGSIIFKLTQNGDPYLVDGKQATADLEVKGSSFTFAFKDQAGNTLQLPKYDKEGNPYTYSVTESFPDDAATSFDQVFEMTHVSRDLQVTNKYIANRRSIQVTKTFDTEGWTEDEIKAGRYPDVEFTLYRVKPGQEFNKNNASQKLKTTTIDGATFKENNGKVTVTFDDLYDVTPSGQRFAYYVVEKAINGYTIYSKVGSDNAWTENDTVAMQSENRKTIYNEAFFKNDYQEGNFITLSASKQWLPDGILSSFDVKNSELTFHVNGYVNFAGSNVDNIDYTQGKDFSIKWSKEKGNSSFTIQDLNGKDLKFRRYTSQGVAYVYRITEDTSTDIWKAGGKLENFNCSTSGHYVNRWATDAGKSDSLNLGTLTNIYGRTSLRVTKQWDDNSNKNDMRPRSITVKLQYKSGNNDWKDVTSTFLHRENYDVSSDTSRGSITENTIEGVTYTLSGKVKDQNRAWSNFLTFNNLPLNVDGTIYSYRVVETAIGGDSVDNNVAASYTYDADKSTNNYNSNSNITESTLRNKLRPASVTVEKTWEDSNNKYLARPDSLTLYLQRKIEGGSWEYVKHSSDDSLYTVTITAADGWKYAEQDTLPREDVNGKKYLYRFTEQAEGATGTDDNLSGVTVSAAKGNISYTGNETTSQAGTFITDTKINNTLEKTSLTVTKSWSSTDGRTPVTFQIQYNDDSDDSNNWTAFKDVTLKLNTDNNWTATINDLPKRGKDGSTRYYRAVELDKNNSTVNFTDNGTTVTSKDGARDFELATGMFRAVYDLTNGDNGTTETVTNIKRTTVNVTKTFQDGANREVYRPSSLSITCESGNKEADSHTRTDNATEYTSSKTISSTTDTYNYSFVVDQYDSNGEKLKYKVTETFANNNKDKDKYAAMGSLSTSKEGAATVILNPKVDNLMSAGLADTVAITNIHGIHVFDLTLTKNWEDLDNFYKERPSSITVTLQYSTDGTNWKSVKKGQFSYDSSEISYSDDVTAGYSTDDATKTLNVNEDGSVKVEDATWHNLPVYARVNETRKQIQYRVLENQVKDYNNDEVKASTFATGDPTKVGQIVKVTLDNVLNTTSVTVTKNWADDNNFNGQRQNIDVQLYQNGTALKNEQVKNKVALIKLTTGGAWTYTFRNLPKQDKDGKDYTYTVDEVNVPNGYTKSVNGTTITNTLNPVKAAIRVTKDFGTNDWASKAPNGFTFTLTRGDNSTHKVTTPMPAGTNGNTATVTITKNTKDLTAAFADISYDHIGEYYYTLTENNGGVDGVAYDWDNNKNAQRTHDVVVTVTKNSVNTLASSVKYDGKDSLTISNDFKTVETSIQVTKDFADWSKTSKGFTFKLTPQGNAPMPTEAVDGAVTKTATANAKTVDFGSISYEKTGTYTYTVQENAGTEDGITYDTTPHKVAVVVTKDANASNKLKAEVKYYDKDGTTELKNGLSVTNTFTPTSDELKVKKSFNDWTKAGSFTFDLTPVDNAPMPAGTVNGKKAVTVTNGNVVGFGSITFDKAGTYAYNITEEKGTASGVQYDTAVHKAVVTVAKDTNNNNRLSVTGITYDDQKADAMVITNTFASVKANLQVKKAFNGWTDEAYGNYFNSTEFTFNISAVTANAPLPTVDGKNVTTATATKADPEAKFAAISFDKEGTYTYNITETNDHKDGISYDGNTHTATVTVTKDQDTNALSVTSIKYDKTEGKEGTITNTYSPVTTKAPIQVTKSFSDWTRTQKGFTFTLTAGDNTAGNGEDDQAITTPMPTGVNGKSMTAKAESAEKATAVFGNITYRKAGTYNYTITEANGEEDGISYDPTTYNVKVEVSKDPTTNALTAEVTYDGQSSLTVTNTVASETAHIQAAKDFNDWNHSASEFTFTLKAEGSAPMPDGAKEGAITGTATSTAPNVDFGAITYQKAGTYNYTITETNDGKDGVSYDTTDHKVTVTVTKATDRTNKLTAAVKYDGDKDSLTITNTFTATTAAIGLTKSFTNPETKENWPVDTSFTFDLAADSNTAGVAKNPMPATTAVTATKDHPSVSFGDITFSKSGTYYYTVTERNSQVDSVSYDTKPHTVAVVVTKGDGNELSTNVYYDVTKNDKGTVSADAATSLTISNTYKPLKQTLKVTKSFNGWDKWSIFDDATFTFTLTPVTANAPMPAGDNGSTATASKSKPEAVFGDITYTKAGTYEYKITETNSGVDGVAYDTSAHNVIVSVSKSKDATNTLSAVVKYDGEDSLTITNTFTPVFQNLSVSKNFNDWTKAKSFKFDLADKDNAPMPKEAGASVEITKDSTVDKATGYPSAAFGQIEFDKAGTYTYTITEENGGEDGVDYTEGSEGKQPVSHEVKVVIAKDEETNALSVETVDSLTVTNTYTPVKAHVEVTKEFNDWSKADGFTFDIAAAGNDAKDINEEKVANPMPKDKDGNEVTEQTVTEENPTAVFNDMTFEYAGVYKYEITERNDGCDGVSYDINKHIVTVTVTKADDATNALSAEVTYEAADDNDIVPEDKSSLTIKNTFTPVKIAADDISKNFNGWKDSEKYGNFFDDVKFDIVLKPVTKDAPMPAADAGKDADKDQDTSAAGSADQTGSAAASGNADQTGTASEAASAAGTATEAVVTATKENPAPAFPEMTFVKAGTYEYTLQEVNGGVDGVDYDTDGTGNPTVHKVVVTVMKADDETNALSASISYDGKDSLEIKNTFTPVDPPLHVTKDFNDWSKADSFTFSIKAITEGAPMPTNLTATATEDEKTAEFSNIEFWQVGKGTYEYEITEVNDGIDGISYDMTPHKAVIQVTKANDATNALSSVVLYDGIEAAKDDAAGLTIKNTFTAATTVLKVTKDFNDWSKASSFKFDLKAKGDAPMPEDENGAVAEVTKNSTTAEFGEIAFDKAGTYTYTITEENTGVDNVTYDTAKHKVEVTVVKDEATNALTVESVKYDGGKSLTIKNTYTAPASGTGTNKSVKTGDNTPLAGWTAMLLAAMCLGFVAMEERRRQKKNHN